MTKLTLFLLGQPRVERDGIPLEVDTRKAIALLSYLAVTHKHHSRDALAVFLWPEYSQSRAYANLRRTLWSLNKALAGQSLDVGRETIGLLHTELDIWIDVDHFLALIASCKQHGHAEHELCPLCLEALTDAVALYRDDFMHGFSLSDSAEFDEWQFFQSESMRRMLGNALERLVYGHSLAGQFEAAITYARRWLALDQLNEVAQRTLMRLYAWSEQWSAARRQYQECVRALDEQLGVPPQEETQQLYEAIKLQQVPPAEQSQPFSLLASSPATPAEPVSALLPEAHRHHLPALSGSFFGRTEELKSIARLLGNPACRLLTLVGPGGIGKTRLAVEAAYQALASYSHGAHFVPCSGISSEAALTTAIADALNFSFYSGPDPKQQLISYLRQKQLLLVIDNAENLGASVGLLAELLSNAPNLVIIVTSIERLNLSEEWTSEIHGLELPERADDLRAAEYGAVQFFEYSAHRVRADFALSDENVADVVRICHLVGGMPLGIELAASWLRVLSCREIVQEVERNLDFLATSLRDVPARHRSIRAVFEYSWQILSEEEQHVLRSLSVFCVGFCRDSAKEVASATLPMLMGLVDKSLLRRNPSGRFEMLNVIRQYAGEKLREADPDQIYERHSAFFTAMLERCGPQLTSGNHQEALGELKQRLEDIRAAWRWMIDHHSDRSQLFAYYLYQFYEMQSLFLEGEEVFHTMADQLAAQRTSPLATQRADSVPLLQHQIRRAGMAYRLGMHERAVELLEYALPLFRERQMASEVAFCLTYLGDIARITGAYDRAQSLLNEGRAICQQLGNRLLLARVSTNLGIVYGWLGEYLQARTLFQESLDISRLLGDLWGTTRAFINLGTIALYLGEHDESWRKLQESLALAKLLHDQYNIAISLNNLGSVAYELKEYVKARQFQYESLQICYEIGYRLGLAHTLIDLGKVDVALGDTETAWHSFRAALQFAVDLRAIPLALDILVELARLVQDHDPAHASAIIGAVLAHPSSNPEVLEVAQGLAAALHERVAAFGDSEAMQPNFDTIVSSLLNEPLAFTRIGLPPMVGVHL